MVIIIFGLINKPLQSKIFYKTKECTSKMTKFCGKYDFCLINNRGNLKYSTKNIVQIKMTKFCDYLLEKINNHKQNKK